MRKSVCIVMLLSLASFTVIAQDEEDEFENIGDQKSEIQTLISSGGIGGYGGLTFGYTGLNDHSAFISGIRGGLIIGHTFTFGIAGYGFVTEQFENIILSDVNIYQMGGGYGGLFLEAIILPLRPVHVSVPVLLGAGGLSYFRSYNYTDPYAWEDYTYSDIDSDAFFVLEPGIEMDVNMLKFMRISIGGSYRYATDVSLTTYVENNGQLDLHTLAHRNALNGWNAYLTFKFGKF